jgi:hypothetical protein
MIESVNVETDIEGQLCMSSNSIQNEKEKAY